MSSGGGPREGARREFGEGVLGRATALVYWYLMVEVLLVVAVLPGGSGVALPGAVRRAMPSCSRCACCRWGRGVGGAVRAPRPDEGRGATPASSFWRGYRLNWADALKVWVPGLVVGW